MKRSKSVRDFDFYIDEYMYNCQSRKLRKKTLQAYEQTFQKLVHEVQDNLESISSVKALAVRTGVSEHLCDMLFQEHLQVSSTRYIKEYRWEKACQMLTQTRKTVSEISAECGMNNSYFSK